ncbi:MAG: chromate efflux transporter, partial [Anaerolineales bacterium]|nr:chromate efflux transporter [Anaerolineales bacterium]
MLREVALLALKLGFTAFGGPAAHIAMLHDEAVVRRRWLDDQTFLDLLGATNLIPGPNSTEMVIHVSYRRAGWPGLIVGGACFIGPAMLSVLALAWAYVRYGTTAEAGWLLAGVKPVIIAVVAQALWVLGRKAVNDWLTGGVALGVLALYFLGVNELLLLALGGLAVLLARRGRRLLALLGVFSMQFSLFSKRALAAHAEYWTLHTGYLLAQTAVSFSLSTLFLTFLKIGAVLYGSGYVLLAFLHRDFVQRLGWLTDQQLIDAIAIGQLTPGPVFTTATF